jgi:hypothetical protein
MLDPNPNEGAAARGPTSDIPTITEFMSAVVPWPRTQQDPGWVVMPNGYVNTKFPGGRDPKTGKYPIGPGKAFKTVDQLVSHISWVINTNHTKDIFYVLSLQRETRTSRTGKLQGKKSAAGAISVKSTSTSVNRTPTRP